jgi:hypothetical protein
LAVTAVVFTVKVELTVPVGIATAPEVADPQTAGEAPLLQAPSCRPGVDSQLLNTSGLVTVPAIDGTVIVEFPVALPGSVITPSPEILIAVLTVSVGVRKKEAMPAPHDADPASPWVPV